MRDLICDVINYCDSSFVVGNISVSDQTVISNLKGEEMNIKQSVREYPCKR